MIYSLIVQKSALFSLLRSFSLAVHVDEVEDSSCELLREMNQILGDEDGLWLWTRLSRAMFREWECF